MDTGEASAAGDGKPSAEAQRALNDPFETAWRELESRWGEDAAHKKFIAFCAAQNALGEAGSRYRRVRETDPARAEEAKKRIDAVLGTAMQSLQLTRTEVRRKSRLPWIALAICVAMIGFVVLRLLRARSQ